MKERKDDFFKLNVEAFSDALSKVREKGDDNFLIWFNNSKNAEQSFIRGAWDFSFYFLTPMVCKFLRQPEELCCLEIGYGGGRILNASRLFFKHSYGVDVHSFHDLVTQKLLERSPARDFTLFNLDSCKIPMDDESLDYIYSFIVIQHFYSISILKAYLEEAARTLKRGGLVNLFFADLTKYHQKFSRVYLENMFKGFMELPQPPDAETAYNTLWVSRSWIRDTLSGLNFKVVEFRNAYKSVPDGYPDTLGSQSGVLAVKL